MNFLKRILLFVLINLLVVATISFLLSLFHVQPYLTQYGLDIKELALFCLIWGMAGALISLSLSRVMAKLLMRVHVIDVHTQDPRQKHLLEMVERLARGADLPITPQVGIYESNEPNAFATGPTKRRSLVAVSTGLLSRMSPEELEGVLAHEISHISNGDMVTMTLLQGVVNAFVMFLARILAFFVSGLAKDRKGSSNVSHGLYMMLVFLFETIFMILGFLVIASYSRFREYRADRGGSQLAGKPKMIGALEALKRSIKYKEPTVAENPAFQSFKISQGKGAKWSQLFATHPPLEKRIERLHQL